MRRALQAGLLLTLLLTLLSGAAQAEGMPQLDFKNPLLVSQVVWGAIIFVVLYLLISRWALPQVGTVLATRADRIAADLNSAQQAKSGSDAAVQELTAATRAAHATAQAEIAAAVNAAKNAAAAQAATLDAALGAKLAAAERQIGAARTAALGALRQVAGDTATEVVTRLTGSPPSPQSVDRAIDAAMAAPAQG